MRSNATETVHVLVGPTAVAIRRSGRSHDTVANILGVERDAGGQIVTIWLDRLVHRPAETSFVGWAVSGAISSVLHRIPDAAKPR